MSAAATHPWPRTCSAAARAAGATAAWLSRFVPALSGQLACAPTLRDEDALHDLAVAYALALKQPRGPGAAGLGLGGDRAEAPAARVHRRAFVVLVVHPA